MRAHPSRIYTQLRTILNTVLTTVYTIQSGPNRIVSTHRHIYLPDRVPHTRGRFSFDFGSYPPMFRRARGSLTLCRIPTPVRSGTAPRLPLRAWLVGWGSAGRGRGYGLRRRAGAGRPAAGRVEYSIYRTGTKSKIYRRAGRPARASPTPSAGPSRYISYLYAYTDSVYICATLDIYYLRLRSRKKGLLFANPVNGPWPMNNP